MRTNPLTPLGTWLAWGMGFAFLAVIFWAWQ